MKYKLLTGDCRKILNLYGPFDLLIADPPFVSTSLFWDKHCEGWFDVAYEMLKPTGSLWVFGSMRMFQKYGPQIEKVGWKIAQDIVWEKHNGSSFQADRFKQVHCHLVQYYRKDSNWRSVYNVVQKTMDARPRSVTRTKNLAHTGGIGTGVYVSLEGGPRLMRSVIRMRSAHHSAIHPTEKPFQLMEILINTSCPPNGLVGDMFSGSGAAGEAALRCSRRYVGCEIDKVMAQRARQRLRGLQQTGGTG